VTQAAPATLRHAACRLWKKAYQLIGPVATITDFHSQTLTITWRQWVGPHWGVNVVADYYHNPTYMRGGTSVGFFREFESHDTRGSDPRRCRIRSSPADIVAVLFPCTGPWPFSPRHHEPDYRKLSFCVLFGCLAGFAAAGLRPMDSDLQVRNPISAFERRSRNLGASLGALSQFRYSLPEDGACLAER